MGSGHSGAANRLGSDTRGTVKRLIFCLPAYNEAGNLPALLERMEAAAHSMGRERHYVICNDGSRDGTRDILRQWAARVPITVLEHAVNMGLGPTIRDALREGGRMAGAGDVLVTMDADNTHSPDLCGAMVEKVEAGADVVIASRYRSGARVHGLSRFREITSLGAGWLFRIVLPIRGVRDYTCGFRMYRAPVIQRAFQRYGDRFVSERGFECMADILIKVSRLGVRCAEVPMVLRYDAKVGASKMRVFKTVKATLRLVLLRRFGVGLNSVEG